MRLDFGVTRGIMSCSASAEARLNCKCRVRLTVESSGQNTREDGAVAQLGARLNRTQEVRGSNPLSSIKLFKEFNF